MSIDLRRLRYFVAVLDTGSFSRAAEKLFVVQSALSAQVKKLEDSLGQQLLVRDARGVRPTEPGRRLLAHARQILDQVRVAENDLKRMVGEAENVARIGIPSSVSRMLTLPLLQAVERSMPGVSLHIAEGLTSDLQAWLAEDRLDLAILYHHPQESLPAQADVLRREPLYLVSPARAAEEDAGAGAISLAELARVDLILPTGRHRIRRQMVYETQRLGITPRIRHELDSLAQTLQLIVEGRGRSVMILSSFLSEWRAGRVSARRVTGLSEEAALVSVWSDTRSGPTLKHLRQLLSSTTRSLARSGAWPAAI